MSKDIGKAERKRGSGVGAFFGGTFFGFLLCIALICGLGAFVYFKVSPQWVNKTFNTNIDLGSEELNRLTLKEAVAHTVNLTQNMDTYTLNNFEKDFGIEIEDKFKGIYIAEIKDVPLDKLGDELQSTLSQISAAELEAELIDLSDMDNIFNKESVFYFNSAYKKLYKSYENATYSDPVNETDDFKYTYDEATNKIIIKGNSFDIVDGEVKIKLKYLPLTTAISSYTSNLGDNLTLQELKEDYGVELPSYIYNGNENKTINEIQLIIDDLYVADVMGYTISEGTVFNGSEPVTGIIGIIAKKKVSELDDIQSTIEEQTIATLLDYTIEGNIVKDKNGNTVTGILGKVAKYSILNVDEVVNDLVLSDVFDSTELSTGVFTLVDNPENIKVTDVADELTTAIQESTIIELNTAGVITLKQEDANKLTIEVDHDNNTETANKQLGVLTIDELLSYFFSKV